MRMLREPKFCKQCGIQLTESWFGVKQYFSFADGDYCPKCAKMKVDKARKNI